MSYAALIVFVEPDGTPELRVQLAASLADKFRATLIGISACATTPSSRQYGLIRVPIPVDIDLMKAKLAKQGEWFRSIADGDRRPPGARSFEKKIVGVTDPRPCDESIDKSAIFPGE
jgi:hypothetical protein